MAARRFSGQTVKLSYGESVKGKNVRVCSVEKFEDAGGYEPTRTVGIARVNGLEIPVRRVRGRSVWEQAGDGIGYTPASTSFAF